MSTDPSTAPVPAGFWRRTAATLIDTVIMLLVTTPILLAIYGTGYYTDADRPLISGPADLLVAWVLPAVGTIWLWHRYCGTPGKILLKMRVVDARNGGALSTRRSVIRYLGYFASTLPLGLGLVWIAFDRRKQAWHDKLAGSIVVVDRRVNDAATPPR